jgi:hypothetical protein
MTEIAGQFLLAGEQVKAVQIITERDAELARQERARTAARTKSAAAHRRDALNFMSIALGLAGAGACGRRF